jgi:hypothetical protein
MAQFRHQGKYTVLLISERRAGPRGMARKDALVQEKGYVSMLERLIPVPMDSTSDREPLREVSVRTRKSAERFQKALKSSK